MDPKDMCKLPVTQTVIPLFSCNKTAMVIYHKLHGVRHSRLFRTSSICRATSAGKAVNFKYMPFPIDHVLCIVIEYHLACVDGAISRLALAMRLTMILL